MRAGFVPYGAVTHEKRKGVHFENHAMLLRHLPPPEEPRGWGELEAEVQRVVPGEAAAINRRLQRLAFSPPGGLEIISVRSTARGEEKS